MLFDMQHFVAGKYFIETVIKLWIKRQSVHTYRYGGQSKHLESVRIPLSLSHLNF